MTLLINSLIVVLLVAGIGVAARLFFMLGDVHRTIKGVEETRLEVNATLKRLEVISQTVDEVMREEVAPTLRVTRETLTHVEHVTRALAETTQIVRRIMGKAAPYAEAAPLVAAVGAPVAQFVARQGSKILSGLGAGLLSGVRGLFRRRKAEKPDSEEEVKRIQGKSNRR